MDTSMKGKTVLFTGASRGTGRFAAIELARRGAEFLVVGHNRARGADTVDAIRATGSSAEFVHADMGDAEEVSALAEAMLARHEVDIDALMRPGPPDTCSPYSSRSAQSRVRSRPGCAKAHRRCG